MTNKLAAAANNFRSSASHTVEKPQPSVADALGLNPPALSAEEKAGYRAMATLANQRFQEKLAAHQLYQKERAEYEKTADDAAWQKVLQRRAAAL
jgi:hypothetical protein